MRKIRLFPLAFLFFASAASALAQGPGPVSGTSAGARGGNGSASLNSNPNLNGDPQTIPLWNNGAPGAMGDSDADKPTLTIYRAGRGGGASVIVAPGGSYARLSMDVEGRQVASWFNALGLTAFVLKYRLAPYHYPVELEDAQRAIRLVRSRAAEFGIAPDEIGMMGFSAGGHLTATAGTHFDQGKPDAPDPIDRANSRPDFLILAYPVISFQTSVVGPSVLTANGNSGKNLLGDHPDPKLLEELSDELQVTPETPPTFLYQGTADKTVPVESSVAFYLALRKAGVPAELHTFEKQGHGGGLNLGDPASGIWPTLLMNWLRGRGLLPNSGAANGSGASRGASSAAAPFPQPAAPVSSPGGPARPSP